MTYCSFTRRTLDEKTTAKNPNAEALPFIPRLQNIPLLGFVDIDNKENWKALRHLLKAEIIPYLTLVVPDEFTDGKPILFWSGTYHGADEIADLVGLIAYWATQLDQDRKYIHSDVFCEESPPTGHVV